MTTEEITQATDTIVNNPLYPNKYTGNDNEGKPKREFIKDLVTSSDGDLYKKCTDYIWLSAFANNNPRSDYHWMCDACYDECQRRNQPEIYSKAHKYIANNL